MSKPKLPTIPPQKPSAELPPATIGQLPALAKATHPVRALKDFAAMADGLADHYGELKTARRNIQNVRETPHQSDAQKYLDEARALLREHDNDFCEFAKELKQDLDERFNPESAFDDDCRLLEVRVRAAIALLLASFPNANPGNPETYVGTMVEEVMAEDDVSLVVLESACSQIRRTSKFAPNIAELVEAIQEQAEVWEPRLNAIQGCGNVVGLIRKELKAATELVAAATAEREERARIAAEKKRADDELRAQPLRVGDRVQNKRGYYMGPGTIADASRIGFYVFYDSTGNGHVDGKDLLRLIPDDSGFEIVEDKRAAIEKRLAEYRALLLLQRQQRLVVGDRVTDDVGGRHPLYDPPQGAGTVVFAGDFEPDVYDDGFSVQFDNGVLGVNIMARQLRRLLPGMFAIGDRVAHGKYGLGTVKSVDGGNITVMFDAVGCKKVVDSLLERAE
jgi:hypothetical protein